jgi:hypothetical protein
VLGFEVDAEGEPIEPPVVYMEHATGEIYLEKETDVRHYLEAHQAIQRPALDDRASRDLLRQIAREFRA